MAATLDVYRSTIYRWCEKDKSFQDVIDEYRGRFLDRCLQTAEATALGIPKLKNGKLVGWIERPDSYMLRYLIGKLGSKEGWGESLDVTSKGESIKPDPVVIEVIDRREQIDTGNDETKT